MTHYDLIIIGGGIAGMTAALGAVESGLEKILILERECTLGGIINQCIHNGFGEKVLGKTVTGPEYIQFLEDKLKETNVEVLLNTNVLEVKTNRIITYVNSSDGVNEVSASGIIFSMGAKERYSGSIDIPTNALTGIFTVGEAHKIVNIEGYLPGKRAIITAKDKRGFILARRLIIEGGVVEAVIIEKSFDEVCNSEIKEIIDGFNIPIIENSKVVDIFGNIRIEGVKVLNLQTKEVTEKFGDCLILTVGFIPENDKLKKLKIELDEKTLGAKVENYKTSMDGVFACGNIVFGEEALHMEDVDSFDCGKVAAEYIKKYTL